MNRQSRREGENPVRFYELPVFAALELVLEDGARHRGWRVSIGGNAGAEQISFERIPKKGGRNRQQHINPWFMRNKFFAIDTVEDAKQFFESFGPYEFEPTAPSKPLPVHFRNLTHAQNFFSDALSVPVREWRLLTKKHMQMII